MRRSKIGVIILSAALIMGCSSNNSSQAEYDSLMAEKQSLEAELEKQKETTIQETTPLETTTEEVTTTVQETTTAVETTAQSETSKQGEEIEVLAEYTLPDGIGWYTRHFVVVRNNTNKTLEISTSSKAYDGDSNVLGLASSGIDALGAGCTTVFYEAFETSSTIASYDMNITYKPSTWAESVIQDLSYSETIINNGAIYDVTNNGNEAAEFVEGYALFFSDDTLVGYDSNYITDDDLEIKSGETISEQFRCYESFDRVEFYLNGEK